MNITGLWIICITIALILMTLIPTLTNNEENSNEKWSQFECGFNQINPSQIPFSLQFFVIALLFLIFDVEIVLTLSFPLEPTSTNNTLTIITFLLIITAGLIYEWQNSNINWSN